MNKTKKLSFLAITTKETPKFGSYTKYLLDTVNKKREAEASLFSHIFCVTN